MTPPQRALSDREVFRRTVDHADPPRVLYHASFTPDLRRRLREHLGTEDVGAALGMFRRTMLQLQRPEGVAAPDYSRYWRDEELPEGTKFGEQGAAMVPAGFYHFFGYVSPLRNAETLAELEQYPIEDVSGWDTSGTAARVADAHADGRVAVGIVGHMYETAWQIRGYEQFLLDMIERPAWAECLLERLAQQNLHKAVALATAGVDYLECGDDVANQNAMMFAPDTWRSMMLSRWARVWRAARDADPRVRIWYHSDGNIEPIVGDLVEAGVDILNPLQPEALDVDAVHARYGDRLTFDGCIGTQTTMPFGSPDDVRARVREVIDKYGTDGGLVVSPTHVLEPEVPIANIEAMCDTCRTRGAA
ncbi:MAG: uroporphyrinogen decarboxylase family protein [Planctomycetota bacterium]